MKIIITKMDDDFTCKCGNKTHLEGFYPCDEKGKEMEPLAGVWKGHYFCDRCKQLYLPID